MNEAETIVRGLAAWPAPLLDGTYANGHDYCTLCGGEGEEESTHDEECPWRMAKEWVTRYDAQAGPVIPFETVREDEEI